MDGLRRTIRRCLGLGGILLAPLLISAGLLAVFSAAGARVDEKVMTVIAAGQIQRIKNPQKRPLGKTSPCRVISCIAGPTPHALPTKMAVPSPPIGRAKLFQMVAIRSRKLMPTSCKLPRMPTAPLPRAEGMASKKPVVVTPMTDFLRDQPWLSMK